MSDNHKHLANTLIEIPKETVSKWMTDAQKRSMNKWGHIESEYVEMYLELKTEQFRIIERNKYDQATLVKSYSEIVESQDKTIKMQEALIEKLKMQIK